MLFFNAKATQARQTTRELNALSNRELADLGIARGDIQSIVRGAYNRAGK